MCRILAYRRSKALKFQTIDLKSGCGRPSCLTAFGTVGKGFGGSSVFLGLAFFCRKMTGGTDAVRIKWAGFLVRLRFFIM